MSRKYFFIQLAKPKTSTSTVRKTSQQLEEQLWGLTEAKKYESQMHKQPEV